MGTAGNSAKSVQIGREERQQGISQERLRLVLLTANQGQYVVRK